MPIIIWQVSWGGQEVETTRRWHGIMSLPSLSTSVRERDSASLCGRFAGVRAGQQGVDFRLSLGRASLRGMTHVAVDLGSAGLRPAARLAHALQPRASWDKVSSGSSLTKKAFSVEDDEGKRGE
ncbi:hypothetical protein CPLU01_05055 [Colletotrichum plurivorum]|uniref:Uncharacterized protein n=1 Tax=Colletotrichum plurivorum TaxID=2175906 RepID=A0A8H6NI36_9PEZI|nr:hypothetical protein CPLU01_05055 [Colletotrichum plurivorum]